MPSEVSSMACNILHAAAAGIVQGQASVVDVKERQDFRSFRVEFPAGRVDGIQIGASVAINGTCLTVRVLNPLYSVVSVTSAAHMHWRALTCSF